MRRTICLLAALLLLAGCAPKSSSPPPPAESPPPASEPAPAPVPAAPPATPAPPAPAAPELTAGPIHLLAPAAKPIWTGPVAVSVENSPQARPQTGLQEADLVVELLAESEITRFLALYWSAPVEKIGPVRSARTSFIAIADAYNAPFAHAGGSAEALATLATYWGGRDLDEIYNSGAAFYRSRDREAPHNLYTTTDLLAKTIAARQLTMKAPAITKRADALPTPGKDGAHVTIDWHRLHQSSWNWSHDRYLRTDDGQPHLASDGSQLSATNLLFLSVEGVNRGPDLGWSLNLARGGKATVLVAGHRWEGSWKLEAGGFTLIPAEGKVPLLAPGSTWVHLITHESEVTIEP